jgi:polar amino acid transport system substrate-binding protein
MQILMLERGIDVLRAINAYRLRFLVLLFACCVMSPALSAADAVKSSVQPGQCKTIIYSTNPQYPPYDWAVDGDRFVGASIELLSLVMPPDVILKPVVYPWKRSMFLAKEGSIDLLVSLRITPERSEYLQFTTHRAFPNPIVLFVRKNRGFPYKAWADLKSRRGGVALGDTFGGGFDEYWRKELQIEEAATMVENFKKLDTGRIDYFITSYYLGQAYLSKYKPMHPIMALKPPISTLDIHFGFSRRSPCKGLIPYVSNRLKELDKEGIPEALLKKYLQRFVERPVELTFP